MPVDGSDPRRKPEGRAPAAHRGRAEEISLGELAGAALLMSLPSIFMVISSVRSQNEKFLTESDKLTRVITCVVALAVVGRLGGLLKLRQIINFGLILSLCALGLGFALNLLAGDKPISREMVDVYRSLLAGLVIARLNLFALEMYPVVE